MKRLTLLWIMALLSTPTYSQECVVLLHGLAKSKHSMTKLESSLGNDGYATVNYDYPSRSASIKALARTHVKNAIDRCPSSQTIHFVTHSMGGLLVRQYLQEHTLTTLGRVVMLGPPNRGSEIVDQFGHWPGFARIGGPAALELGTDFTQPPLALGDVHFEVGIIAGSRSVNLFLSTLLPGQNDGKVTVNNTKLSGMTDHITLPVTHPFMMRNRSVINQVKQFLSNGHFEHGGG